MTFNSLLPAVIQLKQEFFHNFLLSIEKMCESDKRSNMSTDFRTKKTFIDKDCRKTHVDSDILKKDMTSTHSFD